MQSKQHIPNGAVRKYLIPSAVIAIALVAGFYGFFYFEPSVGGHPERNGLPANIIAKTFTTTQLASYAGNSSSTSIYVGLDGLVYDVSAGIEFYGLGGRYHSIAGTDATKMLHIFGGDIIKNKYPVIGVLENN